MTEFRYIPATEAHAAAMAPRLSPADIAEAYAASGLAPEPALRTSLRMSTHAWTCLADGEPACIWGAGPISLLAGKGCAWMLGTPAVQRHARELLRQSRIFVDLMLQTYAELENHVDARHHQALRWLGWLGFQIAPASPHGFLRLPFHRVVIHRAAVLRTTMEAA